MSQSIAAEARAIVAEAAQPVRVGATVKEQLNAAWAALGRPPFWRVRAAFYGEGGSWSAAALRDFQDRLLALRSRRHGRARAANLTLAARHDAAASALEGLDAETYRPDIDRLRNLACELRRLAADRPLAEPDQ